MRRLTLPAKRPPNDAERAWEARARVALGTGQHHFVRVWTAPRSPIARVVITPLLLLATLLIVTMGLLALLVLVTVALLLAFVVWLVRTPLAAIRRRAEAASRRAPGG